MRFRFPLACAPWTLALLLSGVPGCAEPRAVEPPPAPPADPSPIEAVPGDLDVVVRLDLKRMRSALPEEAGRSLTERALGGGEPSSATEVIRQALELADQVWVGFRPGMSAAETDNVLVLRGDFSTISTERLTRGFGVVRDLGGGWHVREAREVPSRAAPARLYNRLDRFWVVASQAEVDAVERVIEAGVRERLVEPPEVGVISVAARLEAIVPTLRKRAPKAARFLSRAEYLTASADLTSAGLDSRLSMRFLSPHDAERGAASLRVFLQLLALKGVGKWLGETEVTPVGRTVSFRAKVPPEMLTALVHGPRAREAGRREDAPIPAGKPTSDSDIP